MPYPALALPFVLLIALIAIGIGWSLVSRCDRDKALLESERALASFLVGAVALHFMIWLVGWFHYGATSVVCVLALGIAAAIPGWRAFPWSTAADGLAVLLRAARHDPWFALLLILCAGLAMNGLIAGLAPPSDYDGLNYHLPLAKFDLERGFISPGDLDPFGYLPPLMGMLYRLPLAIVGPTGAQLIHGLFGLAAAAGTAQLIRRWGGSQTVAAGAAVLFLSIRLVVWEFGTTYVDLGLAAYTVAALLVYAAWRTSSTPGLMILFGILIGGDIGVKFHGFPASIAFGAVMLFDIARQPARLRSAAVGPAVALLVILPFLIRSYAATGNPLYLLVGSDPLTVHLWQYRNFLGVGRSPLDLLFVPWDMSIYSSRYFDGQLLGAPYLLALAPLAWLARRQLKEILPAVIVLAVYVVEWFWLLSQQIRFLSPILPIVAAFAAVGAAAAWSRVSPFPMARAGFALLLAGLMAIQGMFIGAYTVIRAPVSLGLIDARTYLTDTPTIQGSHYASCSFISETLRPGERFAWLASLRSYYCPQAALIRPLPDLEAGPLADYLEKNRVRYVAIQTVTEARDNAEGRTQRVPVNSAAPILAAVLRDLSPAFTEPFAAVYETSGIVAALRRRAMP